MLKSAEFPRQSTQSASTQIEGQWRTLSLYEIAQGVNNIRNSKHNGMMTLDIKDLYVNLPVQNILHITKFWLNKHNNINMIKEQTLYRLKVILTQNFFQ